jgi:hypothetical protein
MRRRFRSARALRRHLVAGALAAMLSAAPPLVSTANAADDSMAYEGFLGLGSAIGSLIYSPLKIVYAVGGTALSAVALVWTFGNTDVAGSIFTQSVGGDYVIVPAHFKGQRKLEFFGPS